MGHRFKPIESAHDLQEQSFAYFKNEVNPNNGLVKDRTDATSPASITATGLALSAYPVAVERGFLSRSDALARTLVTLRFFQAGRQGPEPTATGYKGFYYHFLDSRTGIRTENCELSTIDTTILLAGMLTAASYFTADTAQEREIRQIAAALYRRVDWQWALNHTDKVTNGWTPESGFLTARWEGYSEGLILYILGLGSPTFPLPAKCYRAWTSTYQWKKIYDQEFVYAGPLFIHQLSHIWIDFRGIQDEYMRGKCIDYYENSRRATYAQRAYAIHNPRRFTGYGENCWGVSASDGPGPARRRIAGKTHTFFDYIARGIPHGPDDGTIAPWACMASVPFAPEIVLPALKHFEKLKLRTGNPYGFKATFNQTFPQTRGFWISPRHFALNQGPIVLMIENCHSGLIWRLLRSCQYVRRGLTRAGFTGGWLQCKRK